MSFDDRNEFIADVADALTLDDDVQWDRCAEIAAPADREKLDNLRLITRVLRSRRRAGQTGPDGDRPRSSHWGFKGRVVHALMVIAAVDVAEVFSPGT